MTLGDELEVSVGVGEAEVKEDIEVGAPSESKSSPVIRHRQ
jgi:hypothetical protein